MNAGQKNKFQDNGMTILDHLEELRSRLIRVLISLVPAACLGLFFSKEIYYWLMKPMQSVLPEASRFIATEPAEAVFAYFKVGLIAGVFLVLPYVFYQFWAFVAPALYKKEKISALIFVFVASAFFIGGAAFGYGIVFPLSFAFFSELLDGTNIQFMPQMKSYLSFALQLLIAFGVIFELPIIMLALAQVGIVTPALIKKVRPFVILGIFIIAAVLTPPDVISQLLMAFPLYLLFEVSALIIYLKNKQK